MLKSTVVFSYSSSVYGIRRTLWKILENRGTNRNSQSITALYKAIANARAEDAQSQNPRLSELVEAISYPDIKGTRCISMDLRKGTRVAYSFISPRIFE